MKQKHYKIQKVNNNSFFSVSCDIFKSNSLIFNNTVMLSLKFVFFIFNDHAIFYGENHLSVHLVENHMKPLTIFAKKLHGRWWTGF